jgi:hypothetical protein
MNKAKLKIIMFLAAISILFPIISGCGSEGSWTEDNNVNEPEDTTYSASGQVQKGPFTTGSNVTIEELDDTLTPTGVSYHTTIIDDFGSFETPNEIQSQYVEIIVEGFYFDEIKGSLSEAQLTLHAIADLSTDEVINVNTLTTLEYYRLKYLVKSSGKSFEEARNQAEEEVLNIFNIPNDNITAFNSMDISKSGTPNAILLAVSAILQGNCSVAELTQRISKIGLDIQEDGTINSEAVYLEDDLIEDSIRLDPSSIKTNLENYYSGLGLTVTIADFASYVEKLAFSSVVDLENGLEAYYLCNGSSNDETGNGFNANPVNLSFVDDRFGNTQRAYYFPSKGSYLEIPHIFDIAQGAWSYSIWFKLDNYHPVGSALLAKEGSSDPYTDMPLYISYNERCVKTYNGIMASSFYPIDQGEWYHAVLVINCQTARLYINGDLKGMSTYFGSFDSYNGKYYISEYRFIENASEFIGAVDDIRFYNRALSTNEVAELYKQESVDGL